MEGIAPTGNPFLAALTAPGSSPARKKSKEGGTASGAGSEGQPSHLSQSELTRAFLIHDDILRDLIATTTRAFKLPASSPLAMHLLSAVQLWQSRHEKGKLHPYGSCGTAIATTLLNEVGKAEGASSDFKSLAAEMLEGESAVVAREVQHCSARLSHGKDAVILELRVHVHSRLAPHMYSFQQIICSAGAEVLEGKKPPGALARKARGRKS